MLKSRNEINNIVFLLKIFYFSDSLGSQGKSIDDAFFDDSVYSDLNSSSFSLKSVESWSFDEASVQFC